MTYNYMPQGSIFEDIDGQLYCEVDLLKGIKRPLNRAEIVSNYQPKSCLIENKDGEIFNLIDLLLSVGQNGGSTTVGLQEVIDARTNCWGEEFKTLKKRLDADYVELARELKINRYYTYSGTGELSEIKHTADGIIRGLYIEGNTINENDVRKSVGEESNKITILSKNSDGSKTSTKEIFLPFNGGLKSLNGVCDVVEDREDGVYVIQRISEDYQLLTIPVEYKVAERDLNIDTYQDVTYIECKNNIKPTISFVTNDRVYEGQDVTVGNSKDGKVKNMVIKGQTYQNLINGNPSYERSNNSLIRGELSENDSKITIKRIQTGAIDWQYVRVSINTNLLKNNTTYTVIFLAGGSCENTNASIHIMERTGINSVGGGSVPRVLGVNKYKFTTNNVTITTRQVLYIAMSKLELPNVDDYMTLSNFMLLEGDWTNKEIPTSITGIESIGTKENNKISILSHNKNLFNMETLTTRGNATILNRTATSVTITTSSAWAGVQAAVYKLKPNTTYRLKFDATHEKAKAYIRFGNTDGKFSSEASAGGSNNFTFTMPENSSCALITMETSTPLENITISNIQIVEGVNELVYEPLKEDKKEILLPIEGGLKSLADGTCDTIEQRDDGIYLVQKIGKVVLNGSESWVGNPTWDAQNTEVIHAWISFPSWKIGQSNAISDKFAFKTQIDRDLNKQELHCHTSTNNVYISVNKNLLSTQDVNGIKAWLQANPTTVYYELATPIETKLFNDLESFENSTYLSCENTIKPEYVECEIPYDVDSLVDGLLQENKNLQNANQLIANELEETKGQLEENNNEQIATQLDLDMRIMMLEMGDL